MGTSLLSARDNGPFVLSMLYTSSLFPILGLSRFCSTLLRCLHYSNCLVTILRWCGPCKLRPIREYGCTQYNVNSLVLYCFISRRWLSSRTVQHNMRMVLLAFLRIVSTIIFFLSTVSSSNYFHTPRTFWLLFSRCIIETSPSQKDVAAIFGQIDLL